MPGITINKNQLIVNIHIFLSSLKMESIKNILINIPRVKEYTFESDRKMMSTINTLEGKEYSFPKGS